MRYLHWIVLAAYFFLLFAIIFTSSGDFNQDLGRHLKIGEIIVKTGQIPATNLFSYTNPDFPFINHHWLSEVIYYLLYSVNPLLLVVLKILLFFGAIGILFFYAVKRYNVIAAVIGSLLVTPLVIERSYIRPEYFGYLFFAFTLFIVLSYPKYKQFVYALPLIMVLWVNTHITFVFGMVLLGLFLIRSYKQKKIAIIIMISFLAFLLNPHFIQGALYPFFIFGNYGYSIVENQNLFFLNQIMSNKLITYYFFLSPIVIAALSFLIMRKKYVEASILTIFFVATFYQIRHMPFFVLAAIPTMPLLVLECAKIIRTYFRKNKSYYAVSLQIILTVFMIGLSISFMFNRYYLTFDRDLQFGADLPEDAKGAADFLKQNHLPKNIFNNFDIGGYAIYALYPDYKVFVDNRPEAYPKDFMQNIYIGLQDDDNLRKKIFNQYGIHTVFFAHTDQTPWGRSFISHIWQDKSWKLVYFDSTMMVMTDKTDLADIRLDKSYFQNRTDEETNYLHLMRLAQFYQNFDDQNLMQKALAKAVEINPSSCTINKFLAASYENTPLFYKTQEIKNAHWWCF